LLLNARDAMDEKGGVISVQLSMVELKNSQCVACSAKLEGNYIELSVSDTGSGIEKAMIINIFDPFFTTKGVGKGTGLGLSIVNGIVHHSGGHLLVESIPNVGTTFRLLFPVFLWQNEEKTLNPQV
jgi:signal transduction histidine kinase